MAASTTPAFASTPRTGAVKISTANTALDGTGTLGSLWTAGANGSKIEEITVHAQGTTTAGMIRLFIDDGTTKFLRDEYAVSAVTPSGTVAAFGVTTYYINLVIASGSTLRVSTNNAETFSVFAHGGDF